MAGAIAGVIGGSITFPLDTIKTRLQNNAAGEYSGIMDVIRKTYARSGIQGFYKGLPAVMVGITPEKAIKLGSTSSATHNTETHNIIATILEITRFGVTLRPKKERRSLSVLISDLSAPGLFLSSIVILSQTTSSE